MCPFQSLKQEKYLYSQKPELAKKFAADAKMKGEPAIMKAAPKKKTAAATPKSKRAT